MQLLWINLITDVLPGIALALEPPEPGVMNRAPSQNSGSILGARDLKQLLREGALLAAGPLAAGLYGAARYGAGSPQSRTLAFGSLVTAQLLHAITCRSTQQGIFGPGEIQPNPYLTKTLMLSGASQAAALLIPGLRQLMGITRLDPASILIGAAAGVAPFLIRELEKALNAPTPPIRIPLPLQLPEARPASDFLPVIPVHASVPLHTIGQRPTAGS
jgi:Ca2+-transporting ATPase